VVQPAVDEHQRGFAVLPVVPELKFEPVRIKEVRDWFHVVLSILSIAGFRKTKSHHGHGGIEKAGVSKFLPTPNC